VAVGAFYSRFRFDRSFADGMRLFFPFPGDIVNDCVATFYSETLFPKLGGSFMRVRFPVDDFLFTSSRPFPFEVWVDGSPLLN